MDPMAWYSYGKDLTMLFGMVIWHISKLIYNQTTLQVWSRKFTTSKEYSTMPVVKQLTILSWGVNTQPNQPASSNTWILKNTIRGMMGLRPGYLILLVLNTPPVPVTLPFSTFSLGPWRLTFTHYHPGL
jgi:hypothetical protein